MVNRKRVWIDWLGTPCGLPDGGSAGGGDGEQGKYFVIKRGTGNFPPFHEEIRGILTGLGGGTENSPAG